MQGDELTAVKKTLDLNSELSLVDVDSIEFTDIKSNLTLQFSIDDFAQIYGEELLILNGDNYVYNQSIMDKNKLYIISPLVLIHCEFQQEEIKNMHHKLII